jgi:two-component system OmpR family response regulator
MSEIEREPNPSARLKQGDFVLDLSRRELERAGNKISLQTKELQMLEYFMRHPGVILSKAQLLEKIWNYNFDTQTNIVDVLVCRLRAKVDAEPFPKTIHTVRGIGYVFRPA